MPAQRSVIRLVAAAALGIALALPARAPAQGRPSCTTVVRELHRVSGRNGSRTPDATKIAKRLNVDEDWVERCAASYGRHVKRADDERAVGSDRSGLETADELEYQEVSREEKETEGDRYFTIIEDDEVNRRRLRRFDADSSAEWEPFETHEWAPNLGHVWQPFLLDDDHPNEYE